MIIKGKIHCLFEQSGTFKNEFIKLGYQSEDYDIQNEFNQTDHVIDLFTEIDNAYDKKPSIFDDFTSDDLLMAFFPCIYFESLQMTYYDLTSVNYRAIKSMGEKIRITENRLQKRTRFHSLLYKLLCIAYEHNLRLIIENPATKPHYLLGTQNFPPPTFIDSNRLLRGDYFKKPTAYWFINCEKTDGFSYQNDKEPRIIQKTKMGKQAGICSMERSMISSDYARNFICDFILGIKQNLNSNKNNTMIKESISVQKEDTLF